MSAQMIKPSHKGLLHKALGVAEGHKIPLTKIENALSSGSEKVRKEAQFAKNARGWKK
ncbi:MAG: hypothetical protein ACYC4K_01165 [Thiobacillus sp.]